MRFIEIIQTNKEDPEKLESLYQTIIKENETDEFTADLIACYEREPDNKLFAAWFYRLKTNPTPLISTTKLSQEQHKISWQWAIPLAIINSLLFLLFSNSFFSFPQINQTILVLIWSPVISLLVITFLSVTTRKFSKYSLGAIIGLLLVTIYAFILSLNDQAYLLLMVIHLPILSWAAVGIHIMGIKADSKQRFSFLIKSIEVFVTAGLFLIAGIVFGAITMGMFAALNIIFPESIMTSIAATGAGLIPIFAVAVIYNPFTSPKDQDFSQGVSQIVSILPRLLLPLTLGVLVIYICVIPFFFFEPFKNREVLIIFNLMLFAIMGLLIGATPISEDKITSQVKHLLKAGILAVAILVVLVSFYALSATLYRTILGGLTMNRLTILGWNIINISLLLMITVQILRSTKDQWINKMHSIFSFACGCYVTWSLFLLLALPWFF
jgi:hypothetical protein